MSYFLVQNVNEDGEVYGSIVTPVGDELISLAVRTATIRLVEFPNDSIRITVIDNALDNFPELR